MGDEPEGVLDGPSPEFKVDKSQHVAKGTVGDGVIDADEAKQAAEESLAAMEKHKKKMAEDKEEAKKRELVRAATKGGLGGLASAMAKKEEPKKEVDKAADRVEGVWHSPSAGTCPPCLGACREGHAGAAHAETRRVQSTAAAAHEPTRHGLLRGPRVPSLGCVGCTRPPAELPPAARPRLTPPLVASASAVDQHPRGGARAPVQRAREGERREARHLL